MKNKSNKVIKNNKELSEMYKETEVTDEALKAAHEFRRERKSHWKKPTSVSLDQEDVDALKKIAVHDGIPYQVIMRSFIKEGIRKRAEKEKKKKEVA